MWTPRGHAKVSILSGLSQKKTSRTQVLSNKGLSRHFYSNKTLFNSLNVTTTVTSSNYRNLSLIYHCLSIKHGNGIKVLSASACEQRLMLIALSKGHQRRIRPQAMTAAKDQGSETFVQAYKAENVIKGLQYKGQTLEERQTFCCFSIQ